MAKEKAPAFQFYPKEYGQDENVKAMTHEERGMYVDLLCVCWTEGSIPATPRRLARVLNITEEKLSEVWEFLAPCFVEDPDDPGRLRHERLDKERDKQSRWREQRRKAGRASAKARAERAESASGSDDEQPSNDRSTHVQQQGKQETANSKPDVDTEKEIEDSPVKEMHEMFVDALGGDPPHPSLTPARRDKYRALWDEHLSRHDPWQHVWRSLLTAITESDFHMSQRQYQMPESFLKNPEKRDTWMLKAAERMSGQPNLSKADRALMRRRRELDDLVLEDAA